MKQWEYKLLAIQSALGQVEFLNRYGLKGWELIQDVELKSLRYWILKRRKRKNTKTKKNE